MATEAQKAQRQRMKHCAPQCKGKPRGQFRACMKKCLRKTTHGYRGSRGKR